MKVYNEKKIKTCRGGRSDTAASAKKSHPESICTSAIRKKKGWKGSLTPCVDQTIPITAK